MWPCPPFFWYDTDFRKNLEFRNLVFVGIFLLQVGVIPKEGRPRPCVPVLLLVWQPVRTLGTFLHNTTHIFSGYSGFLGYSGIRLLTHVWSLQKSENDMYYLPVWSTLWNFIIRERSFITGRGGVGNFGPGFSKKLQPPLSRRAKNYNPPPSDQPTAYRYWGQWFPNFLKRSGGII